MPQELKVGDVVRLKSGGPTMTVISIDEHGVMCDWFDGKHQQQRGVFPPAALDLIP